MGDNTKQAQVAYRATDDLSVVPVTPATPLPVTDVSGATACSITSVGDSATSVELLAANDARKWARIVNESTAVLYVACTEAASATNYTAALTYGQGVNIDAFTGPINGLWASDAGGNARVSEFT